MATSEIDNIRNLIEKKGVMFRDFQIGSIETRAAEEGQPEKMIIKGVPAVFSKQILLTSYRRWDGNTVEIYEEVHPDAFDDADMTDVIFNYNHCGRVFARTRNDSLKLNVNKSVGLEMETELWDDDEGHRQLYRDIKRRNIDKMSYAYIVKQIDERRETDEDEGTVRIYWTVRKVKRVLDVSAVDIPAYDATEISARRWIEAESGIQLPERQEELEAESRAAAPAESGREETVSRFELEKRMLLMKLGGNKE